MTRRYLLALDATLAACSAALLAADGGLRARAFRATAQGHAAILPGLAAAALAEAGASGSDLLAVAVTVGPGGFTGLRAGMALASGLAAGAGAPLVAVSTGEALAAALPEALRATRATLAALDSKRGRLFVERFAAGPGVPVSLGPPVVVDAEGLARWLGAEEGRAADGEGRAAPIAVAGDAAPAAVALLAAAGREAIASDSRLPDAAAAGLVALARLGGRLAPLAPEPLYVEPPELRPPAPLRPAPA